MELGAVQDLRFDPAGRLVVALEDRVQTLGHDMSVLAVHAPLSYPRILQVSDHLTVLEREVCDGVPSLLRTRFPYDGLRSHTPKMRLRGNSKAMFDPAWSRYGDVANPVALAAWTADVEGAAGSGATVLRGRTARDGSAIALWGGPLEGRGLLVRTVEGIDRWIFDADGRFVDWNYGSILSALGPTGLSVLRAPSMDLTHVDVTTCPWLARARVVTAAWAGALLRVAVATDDHRVYVHTQTH